MYSPVQSTFHLRDLVFCQLRENKDELVSTKAPDLVVLAAGRLESGSNFLKQLIPGEVSKGVIHLLEAVEVA